MTFYPSAEDSSGAPPLLCSRAIASPPTSPCEPYPLFICASGPAARGALERNDFQRGFPRVSQRIFEGTLVPVMSSQGYSAAAGVYEYTGIAPGHYVIEMPATGGKHAGWYKEMDLAAPLNSMPRRIRRSPR